MNIYIFSILDVCWSYLMFYVLFLVTMQEIMERAKFYDKVPFHPAVFPTIHDAVEYQSPPDLSSSTS